MGAAPPMSQKQELALAEQLKKTLDKKSISEIAWNE